MGEINSYITLKRVIDIVGSLVALVICAPLLFFVALLVKITSPGPCIFKQERLKQGGKRFNCLKFRTMIMNAREILHISPGMQQQFHARYKIHNDPRIIRVGRLLRVSSLDELPQLINVLKGEMSLVGPRPIVPQEIDKYGPFATKFLSIKPGLTGLWQVSGRNALSYEERVSLDMKYIDECSLWLDLKILFVTLPTVLKGSGW